MPNGTKALINILYMPNGTKALITGQIKQKAKTQIAATTTAYKA